MDLRLSTKAEYGLKAMIDLAAQSSAKPVQVIDVARRQSIPRESLAVLMVGLRRAGLVTSVRGPSGGYLLAKSPDQISLREIIEALEGSLERQHQQKRSRHWVTVAIQDTWNDCLKTLLDSLEQTSLESLVKQQTSSRSAQSAEGKSLSGPPDGYAFSI